MRPLSFRFKDKLGRYYETTETTYNQSLLEDDENEKLLYLKSDPSKAVLFDAIPGSPQIDAYGNIEAAPTMYTLMLLALPTVTILGHRLYTINRFL